MSPLPSVIARGAQRALINFQTFISMVDCCLGHETAAQTFSACPLGADSVIGFQGYLTLSGIPMPR